MSNWSLKKPPTYRPDAVASALGWVTPDTGEVLVAINGLTTKQGPLASWPTFTLAVPADGTYHIATPDTLTFTVTSSKQLAIAGTPSIDVTINATVRQAAFTGIDATGKIMTFAYTLQASDTADANGIIVANTIDLSTTGKGKSRVVEDLMLNSGETIPAASLTFTVPATTGILVA
jgi:hypothetical protein